VVQIKHPGIETSWILRVLEDPLQEHRQSDGRYALWGVVPEAGNCVLRVITLQDKETVHNAFFDRGFLRRQSRSLSPSPAAPAP
jgi:hypothetical protein